MFNTIEEAIDDLRKGKIIVVTDDPDRENEGDLICAGEFATQENVNFMASFGKGLICMPLSRKIAQRLNLKQMVEENTDNHCTAFTVSIDHISTTTGISAYERSVTALRASDKNSKPEDFRRPGHMFPLEAKEGGVDARNGHTEATVDLMKLAGLEEIGLCCEIMAGDGTMMRTAELIKFAQEHNLKIITISNLQEYKKKQLKRVTEANLPTKYGSFKILGYEKAGGEHHIALIKGNVGGDEAILVRLHSECLTGDVFGSEKCDCGDQLKESLKMISKEGKGILIYLRQEGRGIGLINKIRAYSLQDRGMDTVEANIALGFAPDLRKYEEAALILKDLGVKKIRLITNNPEKIEGMTKNGIEVLERIPIETRHKKNSVHYMETKKLKMGHILKTY